MSLDIGYVLVSGTRLCAGVCGGVKGSTRLCQTIPGEKKPESQQSTANSRGKSLLPKHNKTALYALTGREKQPPLKSYFLEFNENGIKRRVFVTLKKNLPR